MLEVEVELEVKVKVQILVNIDTLNLSEKPIQSTDIVALSLNITLLYKRLILSKTSPTLFLKVKTYPIVRIPIVALLSNSLFVNL